MKLVKKALQDFFDKLTCQRLKKSLTGLSAFIKIGFKEILS